MAYDPPPRLRRLPSWLTAQVARTGERLVAEALAGEGVRRPHFTVLTSLAEQGPASQATLGRRLWIDRSDLHAIVSDLERDGLISRVRDAQDRRRNLVALTSQGKRTLKRLDRAIDAAQEELLAPLKPAERRQLRELLARLVERAR
jgi:DNA-binding MarR family transcriptional regulator